MYRRFKYLTVYVLLLCLLIPAVSQTVEATVDQTSEQQSADGIGSNGQQTAVPDQSSNSSDQSHEQIEPLPQPATTDTPQEIPDASKQVETENLDAKTEPDGEQDVPKQHPEEQNGLGEETLEDEQKATDTSQMTIVEDENPPPHSDTVLQSGQPVKDINMRARRFHRFVGGVSAIADAASDRSFFAAGKDGFITRYTYGRLQPETWQVSALPISLIAVHPKKTAIAIYETDGFSVHRISLWDWKTKKQLYVKQFTSSVLSLAWSAQGSYLFIGTASVEGITVLDARGNVKKIYQRPPGIVLLAATGPSEKSIVTYGETGRLVYADIAKRSILTQYETEDRLQNPELIKNYTRIIGYKNGNVIVIKAASGEILETYPAQSALFAGKTTDALPVWIEEGSQQSSWHLCQGSKKSPAFTLPDKTRITAARHVDSEIVIGTENGKLYRLQQGSDALITCTEVNTDEKLSIADICVTDSAVYMLAEGTLYAATAPHESPQAIITHIAAQRCTAYGAGFLCWSDGKTAPLYYVQEGQDPVALYRPREPLNSVSVYGDRITAVHAFSGLVLLDGKSGKKLFEYQAAGLQEAVQVDERFILVAKTADSAVGKPLLLINIETSETIPLALDGDLVFSLRANNKLARSFSCLRFKADSSAQTDLITMKVDSEQPIRSSFSTALSYSDEDLYASLYDEGSAVVTNLGQGQLVYYDKSRKQVRRLVRDYALPRKVLLTNAYIIGLNYDGSLSWFKRNTFQLMENYRLTY